MSAVPESRVLLGAIVAAHGLKGEVKVKCFTSTPEAIAAYGALEDVAGARRFALRVLRPIEGGVVAAIAGVSDRTAAEALRGTQLYVARDALPAAEEDEFYHVDLIGLRVEDEAGAALGTVVAVHQFGANDVLEIRPAVGPTRMLPFTRDTVPVVDIAAGRLVAVPPAEVAAEMKGKRPAAAGDAGKDETAP